MRKQVRTLKNQERINRVWTTTTKKNPQATLDDYIEALLADYALYKPNPKKIRILSRDLVRQATGTEAKKSAAKNFQASVKIDLVKTEESLKAALLNTKRGRLNNSYLADIIEFLIDYVSGEKNKELAELKVREQQQKIELEVQKAENVKKTAELEKTKLEKLQSDVKAESSIAKEALTTAIINYKKELQTAKSAIEVDKLKAELKELVKKLEKKLLDDLNNLEERTRESLGFKKIDLVEIKVAAKADSNEKNRLSENEEEPVAVNQDENKTEEKRQELLTRVQSIALSGQISLKEVLFQAQCDAVTRKLEIKVAGLVDKFEQEPIIFEDLIHKSYIEKENAIKEALQTSTEEITKLREANEKPKNLSSAAGKHAEDKSPTITIIAEDANKITKAIKDLSLERLQKAKSAKDNLLKELNQVRRENKNIKIDLKNKELEVELKHVVISLKDELHILVATFNEKLKKVKNREEIPAIEKEFSDSVQRKQNEKTNKANQSGKNYNFSKQVELDPKMNARVDVEGEKNQDELSPEITSLLKTCEKEIQEAVSLCKAAFETQVSSKRKVLELEEQIEALKKENAEKDAAIQTRNEEKATLEAELKSSEDLVKIHEETIEKQKVAHEDAIKKKVNEYNSLNEKYETLKSFCARFMVFLRISDNPVQKTSQKEVKFTQEKEQGARAYLQNSFFKKKYLQEEDITKQVEKVFTKADPALLANGVLYLIPTKVKVDEKVFEILQKAEPGKKIIMLKKEEKKIVAHWKMENKIISKELSSDQKPELKQVIDRLNFPESGEEKINDPDLLRNLAKYLYPSMTSKSENVQGSTVNKITGVVKGTAANVKGKAADVASSVMSRFF